MIIPYSQLKKAREYTKKLFMSKFNNQTYKLVDFNWKPYKEPNPNQERLI